MAAWVPKHLAVARRPMVVLAGANSTPGTGCLTLVGTLLEAHLGEARISVSDFSPPGSGPGPVWRP